MNRCLAAEWRGLLAGGEMNDPWRVVRVKCEMMEKVQGEASGGPQDLQRGQEVVCSNLGTLRRIKVGDRIRIWLQRRRYLVGTVAVGWWAASGGSL